MARSNIAASAARLRWLTFAAMPLLVVVYVLARLNAHTAGLHVQYESHGGGPIETEVTGDISVILLLVALLNLARMFGGLAAGEMFSTRVVATFRGFAFWLLLFALFQLLAPIAFGIADSASGDHQRLRLIVDMRDILAVGITSLMFLLARVLERARQIDDEMREII